MNQQQELTKIIRRLMMTEGFYGLLLVGMHKSFSKTLPTACVGKPPGSINIELVIGEEFWGNLENDNQKVTVLKHEILHVALMHFDLLDLMPNDEMRGIAVDIVVNGILKKNGNEFWKASQEKKLPVPILNELFPELKMKDDQGATYYYNELMKAKRAKEESKGKGEDSKADKKGNGKGTSGSKNLDEILDNYQELHENWKDFKDLSEAEKKLVQKQVEAQMKQVAEQVQKDRGNIPVELQSIIDSLFEVKEPALDWKAYLRRFVGRNQTTIVKRTRKVENWRFPDSPGLKKRTKKRLAFCVDQSGSMDDASILAAFSEVHHIYKTGTDVRVVEWDYSVHNNYNYTGNKIATRSACGGTQASCAIDWVNERAHEYDVMIIFTDGFIEPKPNLSHIPTLWLITKGGSDQFDHPAPKLKITID